jgi:hypothetical protein
MSIARKMWRTLEPYHGMIYFVPEASDAYGRIGIGDGRMGYFASRAAAMGPVPAEVVIATFFNFYPGLVRLSIPEAWRRADPEKILQARYEAADAALRRLLGDVLSSREIDEAASLARDACAACTPEGRPLYAGHAGLAWPDGPHLVLWHALTLLREYRGDGHIAAMTAEGVTGCEALILHAGTGAFPAQALKASRAWPDDEWDAAWRGLVARGWIAEDGSLTDAGARHRAWVEERTDLLAQPPWDHIGAGGCSRLRERVRPWSRAIADAGTFGALPFRDDG